MKTSNGVRKLKFTRLNAASWQFRQRRNYLTGLIIPVLLLTALVLIGADCGEEERRRSRDEDEEENYLTYENEKWDFEIKYPEDWEKEEEDYGNEEFTVAFITPPEDEDDEVEENLLVYASTAQPDDFDELMADLIEDLSGDPYVTLLGYERVMISGHPGYKASYIYEEIQYLHYFINAGDTWYQVLYVALESTYSKYLDQIETMIDSLEIK